VLRDRTIGGEEAVRVPRRLEPLHPSFPLPRRLMGALRPIVQIAVLAMVDARQDLPFRRAVAFQLISDDAPRHIPASFEELSKEPLLSCFVSAALYQDVEHVPLLIHRAPEIVALPLIVRKTSSRCHVSPRLGRRCRH
jgi:hypothetical protein